MRQKLTIKDVARHAGVSPAAVSFAFHSRPGVSSKTREHILQVAAELGWAPNVQAGILPQSRAGAIGLFIPHPDDSFSLERFYFNFLFGLQESLSQSQYDLLLANGNDLDDELSTYRKWYAQHRVDGVVVVNPQTADPRAALLAELGLPAVFVGSDFTGFPSIISDEKAITKDIANFLISRGSRFLAYISGPAPYQHTIQRVTALEEHARQKHIRATVIEPADYSERSGFTATNQVLSKFRQEIPDTFIFDNEVLLMGGLRAIRDAKLTLGQNITFFCWEDSPICRLSLPPISAVSREPADLGRHAGQLLQEYLGGSVPSNILETRPAILAR